MKKQPSFWPLLLLALIALQTACTTTSQRPDRAQRAQAAAAQSTLSAQEYFLEGNAFLDQSKWQLAINSYNKALAQDPTRWDIYMNRALAYSSNTKFEEAIASIELALDNGGSEQPVVYYNLGNIYQNRGLYGQSIDAYRAGMAISGKLDVDSLLNIAAAYTFLNEIDDARATLLKIRELAPDDPRAPHGLALLLHLEEKIDEAIQAYEQIHVIAPNFSQSYFNRGFLLVRMARFQEAIAAFQKYIELDPDGPYVKRASNNIASAQKRLESHH